jgi:predicted DNA-binding transcriptional regulator AlpA
MKIDPAELIEAREVAEIIGLSRGSNVSLYRRRYPDFPEPVVTKQACVLWLRSDVEAWAKATGRLP